MEITEDTYICSKCKHLDDLGFCSAFTDFGIPNEILNGENDHSKPLKGQKNNIVFEPLIHPD